LAKQAYLIRPLSHPFRPRGRQRSGQRDRRWRKRFRPLWRPPRGASP